MSNEEIMALVDSKKVPAYRLEKELGDCMRAVEIRRLVTRRSLANEGHGSTAGSPLDKLPYKSFDETAFYNSIHGTNCEAVIGSVQAEVNP